MALWAVLTHCWRAEACGFRAVPYVNFIGVRGSGKNHAIHALGSLTHNFVFVGKATEAGLRDTVHNQHPALGVAECEKELKAHNSYVHILFNSGYVPDEPFVKMVDGAPTPFDVFCPKMMATVS